MLVVEYGYAHLAVFQGITERFHDIWVIFALADEIEQVGKGLVAGRMNRAHGNIAVRSHHIGKPRIVIEGHGIGSVQRLDVIALEQVCLAPVGEIHRRIMVSVLLPVPRLWYGNSKPLRACNPLRVSIS